MKSVPPLDFGLISDIVLLLASLSIPNLSELFTILPFIIATAGLPLSSTIMYLSKSLLCARSITRICCFFFKSNSLIPGSYFTPRFLLSFLAFLIFVLSCDISDIVPSIPVLVVTVSPVTSSLTTCPYSLRFFSFTTLNFPCSISLIFCGISVGL